MNSAIRGAVAGGGIGLALAADIVNAADDAVFRAGYPGIGLSPDLHMLLVFRAPSPRRGA